MSERHAFILAPGEWLGEGILSFSSSPEKLNFITRWSASSEQSGQILCSQRVEMREKGIEPVINQFKFSDLKISSFNIELINDLVGKVNGKGVIDPKRIAWEFRGDTAFEGFEVYDLLDNGEYRMHAEYVSGDEYRTTIEGRVWKKAVIKQGN